MTRYRHVVCFLKETFVPSFIWICVTIFDLWGKVKVLWGGCRLRHQKYHNSPNSFRKNPDKLKMSNSSCLNPFPHIDAFWLFENIATKEETVQKQQFLLSFKESFQKQLGMFSKLSAAVLLYVGKGEL